MDNCREMTVREYIESMKDFDNEKVSRILELYDRGREENALSYCRLDARLRQQIEEKDIIISCLARQVKLEACR